MWTARQTGTTCSSIDFERPFALGIEDTASHAPIFLGIVQEVRWEKRRGPTPKPFKHAVIAGDLALPRVPCGRVSVGWPVNRTSVCPAPNETVQTYRH